MEGRDIATVVFPEAPLKLFLRADPDRRVGRRADERGADDPDAIGRALQTRDARDARTNPLAPARGAVVIDTTHRSIEETLTTALEEARRIWPAATP